MTVMWITDQDCTSWVEYGLDRCLDQTAHHSRHGLIDAGRTVHKVKIQGLLPGTSYYYRVRSKEILDFDDEDVTFGDTVSSKTFAFTTLSRDKEAFSFVVLNDTHEKNDILTSLVEMAEDGQPGVVNTYSRSVRPQGNRTALDMVDRVFEVSEADWRAVIDVNLNGLFFCCQAVAPAMIKQGKGSIVNIASMSGLIVNRPQPQTSYNTSKAAVIHLTKSLAAEWAPHQIRVNAILPGAVDTPMLRAGLTRDHAGEGNLSRRLENLADKTVIGRIGTPDEIAQAIYFLADSDQSSFMTGQALIIDGGATARLSTE